MKIIHTADVHLASKIEAKLKKDKSDERKAEVRATFKGIVEYAKANGISVIMLAGDVFDSDRPLKKDKEFFYSVVKNNPSIDFLYLRGNHDNKESYIEKLDNLKTFSDEWTYYDYGEAVICGVELSNENASSIYSSLKLDKNRKNIVMLHGQVGDKSGADRINISKLRNKNINYLALGHIHSYSANKLDEGSVYVYCGCPEGRGFDELGEKGFVEVEIGKEISHRFIPACKRKNEEIEIDVSSSTDPYTAYNIVRGNIKCGKDDLVRVVLTGRINYDGDGLAAEIEKHLAGAYYFVTVKDETLRDYDLKELEGDKSLRGEFIRLVYGDESISADRKREIISAGLKALDGKEEL